MIVYFKKKEKRKKLTTARNLMPKKLLVPFDTRSESSPCITIDTVFTDVLSALWGLKTDKVLNSLIFRVTCSRLFSYLKR